MIDTAPRHANLLFQGLSPDEIDEIIAPLPRCRLAAGDILFHEGDAGAALYLVVSGTIEIFTTRRGEHITIRTFMAESYFGELTLIGQQTRSASARAVEESILLEIDGEALERITSQHPIVFGNIGRVLAEQLVTTTRTMVHVERGELVMVVMVGLRQRHDAVQYLLDASTALTHGRMAMLGPNWLFPNAVHVASAIREHVRPEPADRYAAPATFAYRAGALLEARAGSDAVRLMVDYFRRGWQRTVIVIGDDERRWYELALPLADRVFVIGTPAEIASWSYAAGPATPARIEAAPILEAGESRRDAVRALKSAGFDPPLVWLSDLNVPDGRFDRRHLTDLSLPHQRGLLRLARGVAKTRVGLALGAGGARGLAHIGVVRYLEEFGVAPDAIAGTSMGALVGAGLAKGLDSHGAEELMRQGLQSRIRRLLRPTISRHSIFSPRGLEDICRWLYGDLTFVDLATPTVIVATDLVTGRGVALRNGSVARAVRASVTIPGIFPPSIAGPYVFIDGGICEPVPTSALASLGADVTISVNISVTPDDMQRWAREEGTGAIRRTIRPGSLPNMLDTYQAAINIAVSERAHISALSADVAIRPRFRTASWREFSDGPEHLRRGHEAAERAAEQIKTALPWVTTRDGG